jgi:hypothetical protein
VHCVEHTSAEYKKQGRRQDGGRSGFPSLGPTQKKQSGMRMRRAYAQACHVHFADHETRFKMTASSPRPSADEISQLGDEILQVANPRNAICGFPSLGNTLKFKAISPRR